MIHQNVHDVIGVYVDLDTLKLDDSCTRKLSIVMRDGSSMTLVLFAEEIADLMIDFVPNSDVMRYKHRRRELTQ